MGLEKTVLKKIIENEIKEMVKIIDCSTDHCFDTQNLFSHATLNIIACFGTHKRPAYQDPKFQAVMAMYNKLMKFSIADILASLFPIVSKYRLLTNLIELNAKRCKMIDFCHEYFRTELLEHRKTFDSNKEPRDFIDAMLLAEKSEQAKCSYNAADFDYRIIRTVNELFIAGSDTTATQLTWIFLLLALNPEIQNKMQQEIDATLLNEKTIGFEMKDNLPFSCAVIDEAMRFSSVSALAVV